MWKKIKRLLKHPWFYIVNKGYKYIYPVYQKFIVPILVKRIRNKEIIDVLFVIYELGSWKTENLYLYMLNHIRFRPFLLLVPYNSASDAYVLFERYLKERNYDYLTIGADKSIKKEIHPDIIFYQKPYSGSISKKLSYPYNLTSLLCYVGYSFRNRIMPSLALEGFQYFLWQHYVENDKIIEELSPILYNNAKNLLATGLPFMDALLQPKEAFLDVWKIKKQRKRIIFAPHHTVFSDSYISTSPIDYSTFLLYCDFMIEMVEKYKNEVQWAFKPHPLLKSKLYKIWGEEKTNAYYRFWSENENSQLSDGEYIGLFMHSDALIHDCGSFKIEYLYTGKPVMYLINGNQEYDYPNWQTTEALNLHYKGYSKVDIENFILDVISGKDILKEKRKQFIDKYLTPSNKLSACCNITNAIIGEEYSNLRDKQK